MAKEMTEMDPLAQSLVGLFFSLEQIYETSAEEIGVSRQQAQLLCVADYKNPALGEVADALHCDKTNVTGLVDRVERQGLIERVPDENDRRVTRIALTSKGRNAVSRFHYELNERLQGFGGSLNLDARTVKQLTEHLNSQGIS